MILDGQTSPDQVKAILEEMRSYRGFWSESTTKYIEGLSRRRDEIIEQMKAYKVETPVQITCGGGKCQKES